MRACAWRCGGSEAWRRRNEAVRLALFFRYPSVIWLSLTMGLCYTCLLYTSYAADDLLCVDSVVRLFLIH